MPQPLGKAVDYDSTNWDSNGECASSQVFLDIRAVQEENEIEVGRITIELLKDIVPKTCENFRQLCSGELGFGYRGNSITRVVSGFILQAGDISCNNGTSGRSIYGPTFPDENFNAEHGDLGTVSMVNFGPDTNQSQFQILLTRDLTNDRAMYGSEADFRQSGWMDGVFVVIGKVIEGENGTDVLRKIESEYGTADGEPSAKLFIHACGHV